MTTSFTLFRPAAALLLAAWFPLAHAEAPAPKRAITHEDVWLMKRIGSPVASPDGKWAVFSVTDPAYDSKEQWSDLWLKSLADEAAPRRLTFSKSGESGAAWSPDGSRLAFVAKRDGDDVGQIYVLNLATGGEAERVTTLALGARQPKWSPDGTRLLFLSDVYPGNLDEAAVAKSAKERKDRKSSARAYDSFPPRFFDKWLDDKQVRLFVMDAKAGAVARNVLAGTKIANLPGFGGRQSDDGQMLDAVWTPDGKGIVFAAATNRDEAARAAIFSPLYEVSVAGGEARQLTQDRSTYSQLGFTPDGSALLAVAETTEPGKVYSLNRLASLAWPFKAGAAPTVLTSALDRSVSGFAVPAGSKRVFFTYEHAGLEQLHSIDLGGRDLRAEASPASGSIASLRAGGRALVGVWESAVNPPEVYAFHGGPRRLTSYNTAKAAAIDWQPPEHFWFKAADGRQVHNMIVKPAGFDPAKKYPVFAVIHGGPASMWRDQFVLRWNYHLLAKPGYIVLLTDYKGSTGYGESFARAIQFDPMKGPGEDVDRAVDEAIKRYPFVDGSRLAAGGGSYGGHLANWLQATSTRYKAFVSHAGAMDLVMQWGSSDSVFGREVSSGGPVWGSLPVWRDQSPVMQAGNHDKGTGFKSPILITVGELDYRCR